MYFSMNLKMKKSGLRDLVDWGKKWLVDFGKIQQVSFEQSNNTGSWGKIIF